MKKRLHYVDVCKGLLILMVIWQHIPAFVSWAGVDSSVIESCGGAVHGCFGASICKPSFLPMAIPQILKKI